MSDSERFALAARLYSSLKRSTGRVIDVLWLLQNEPYSQEVICLARAADAESVELAQRLEVLLRGERSRPTAATASAAGAPGTHYVRGLR